MGKGLVYLAFPLDICRPKPCHEAFYVAKLWGDSTVQTQRLRKREDPETSDGVLVQQAFNGDQEAFESLVGQLPTPVAM